MDKGFLRNFCFGVLIVFFFLLTGCGNIKAEYQPFECHYENRSTHDYYHGCGSDRMSAMSKGLKECEKGPVPWNCYFRYCKPHEPKTSHWCS